MWRAITALELVATVLVHDVTMVPGPGSEARGGRSGFSQHEWMVGKGVADRYREKALLKGDEVHAA
jgi:hypothetical protein